MSRLHTFAQISLLPRSFRASYLLYVGGYIVDLRYREDILQQLNNKSIAAQYTARTGETKAKHINKTRKISERQISNANATG
jgi:hypothetical protein